MSLLSLPRMPRKHQHAPYRLGAALGAPMSAATRRWLRWGLAKGRVSAADVCHLRDEGHAGRLAAHVAQGTLPIPRLVDNPRFVSPPRIQVATWLRALMLAGDIAPADIPRLIHAQAQPVREIEAVLNHAERRAEARFAGLGITPRHAPFRVAEAIAGEDEVGLSVEVHDVPPLTLCEPSCFLSHLAEPMAIWRRRSSLRMELPSGDECLLGWNTVEMHGEYRDARGEGNSHEEALHAVAERNDLDPDWLAAAVESVALYRAPPISGPLTERDAQRIARINAIIECLPSESPVSFVCRDAELLHCVPAIHAAESVFDERLQDLDDAWNNDGPVFAILGPESPASLGWIEQVYAQVIAFNAIFEVLDHA